MHVCSQNFSQSRGPSQRLSEAFRGSHQTLPVGNGTTLAINMSAPYQQRAVLWQVPVLFVFYWAIYCRLLSFNGI